LAPERTLQLLSLPGGDDPDSLVRRDGARAFQSALVGARPLAECLFDILRQGTSDATPEQRAAFRSRLEDAARKISNRELADEYRREFRRRFFEVQKRNPGRDRAVRLVAAPGSFRNQPAPVRTGPRPQADTETIAAERMRILTAIVLRHPAIFHDVEHAFAGLELNAALKRVRDAVGEWANHAEVLDSQALMDHLHEFGLRMEVERILAGAPVPLPACASAEAQTAEAEEGWWHIFGFLNVNRLRDEVMLAREEAAKGLTPETQRRLVALISALNKVCSGEPDGIDLAAA